MMTMKEKHTDVYEKFQRVLLNRLTAFSYALRDHSLTHHDYGALVFGLCAVDEYETDPLMESVRSYEFNRRLESVKSFIGWVKSRFFGEGAVPSTPTVYEISSIRRKAFFSYVSKEIENTKMLSKQFCMDIWETNSSEVYKEIQELEQMLAN